MGKVSIQTPTPFGIGDGTTKSFSVGGTGEVVDSMDVKSIYRADANGNNLLYQNVGPLAPGSYSQYPQGINNAICNRSTPATYIDQNGVLQTAAPNVPRYQNGALLVEAAATNLMLYSEADPGWAAGGSTPPTVNSTDVVVDGITCTSTTFPAITNGFYGVCRVTGTFSTTNIAAGQNAIASSWVKLNRLLAAGESIFLYVTGSYGSNGFHIDESNSAQFLAWAREQDVAPFAALSDNATLFFTITNIQLNGPLTVYSSRRQLEISDSVASSYIPTTSAPATRAADQIVISDYTIS